MLLKHLRWTKERDWEISQTLHHPLTGERAWCYRNIPSFPPDLKTFAVHFPNTKPREEPITYYFETALELQCFIIEYEDRNYTTLMGSGPLDPHGTKPTS